MWFREVWRDSRLSRPNRMLVRGDDDANRHIILLARFWLKHRNICGPGHISISMARFWLHVNIMPSSQPHVGDNWPHLGHYPVPMALPSTMSLILSSGRDRNLCLLQYSEYIRASEDRLYLFVHLKSVQALLLASTVTKISYKSFKNVCTTPFTHLFS